VRHPILFCFTLIAFLLFFGVTGFVNSWKASAASAHQKENQQSQETAYTIQIGSFKDADRAQRQFIIMEQSLEGTALQALRIEKIGTFYVVRIGKFSSLTEAEQFLREYDIGLEGAMAMKAYFIHDRIVRIRDGEGDVPERKAGLPEELNLLDIPPAENDLGLKLIGTVLADQPDISIAIIENLDSGDQEVYKEGDKIKGILVKRILNKRVVINEGKGDEMLIMGGGTHKESRPSKSPMVQLEKKVVESEVHTYSRMMKDIRVRPYRHAGRPGGFMIYNIKPDSIYAKMGLENGDVITAVKGKPIKVTQQAAYFHKVLRQGGEVTLNIKRGESSQELRFEIK